MAELEPAIAELERWATLERIEELLYRPWNQFRDGWSAIVSDVLSGRSDRSAEDVARMEATAAEPGDFQDQWVTFKGHVAEFRAAHPKGIR